MGSPLAGHLLRAGLDVIVWNRTPSKSEPLGAAGATIASSLQELGAQCESIALCVGATEDVEQCVEALVTNARPGTLLIDHSTISPQGALRFHDDLKARGFRFVDAPMTGGSMGAQNGQLTIFLGGLEKDCLDAQEFVKPYAKTAERVGGPGKGQMMKLANQVAVAGALQALCEAMSFAKKAGLDLSQTQRLLSSGAAGSWAFENYGPKIINEDWSPGFSVKNQNKDLRYCIETARSQSASVPGTKLVNALLDIIEAEGEGEKATTYLYQKLLEAGFVE